MTSDPCVNTTFPSNVAIFLPSSAVILSDSMFTGLSRSARSANAGSAASIHIAASTWVTEDKLLPGWHIERAPNLRLQRELLLGLVDYQPDSGQGRSSVGNRDRLIRANDPLSGEHVEELGARAKLRPLLRGLAHDEHVAVEEHLLRLAIYGAATRGRDVIASVGRDLHHTRVEHLSGAVVGEMLHLGCGKCV